MRGLSRSIAFPTVERHRWKQVSRPLWLAMMFRRLPVSVPTMASLASCIQRESVCRSNITRQLFRSIPEPERIGLAVDPSIEGDGAITKRAEAD